MAEFEQVLHCLQVNDVSYPFQSMEEIEEI